MPSKLLLCLSTCFLLLFTTTINGQGINKRSYATIENMNRLEEMNEAIKTDKAAYEDFIANIEFIPLEDWEQIDTLPIIFHIVYSSDADKPNMEQIEQQINALNRDFRKEASVINHPADTLEGFADYAVDTGISFQLADVQLEGQTLKGINFIKVDANDWGVDDAVKFDSLGGMSAYQPEKYINIWVCNQKSATAGYAQMPWGPVATDGIVIDYQVFGIGGTAISPYDEGKTLTHLMGNYLGLYPLYGPDRCMDDFLRDTPIHNAPNYRGFFEACPEYRHFSTCSGTVEMTMNFMDTTDDICVYMFTSGQKGRMKKSFFLKESPRNGLLPFYEDTTEVVTNPVLEINPTFIVTNTNEDGPNSLRQAILAAEALIGLDTIDIQVAGTITLSTCIEELISNDLCLGFLQNKDSLFIKGNGIVLETLGKGRLFYNRNYLELQDATLQGVQYEGSGGAITNQGILKLKRVLFANNTTDLIGGAIRNLAGSLLEVDNCTFSGNQSGRGGALYNDGMIQLSYCTFTENRADEGGAILNHNGSLQLNNTIVANSLPAEREDILSDFGQMTAQNNIVESCKGAVCPTFFLTTDPSLGSLQDNGGLSYTHALLEGSIAINDSKTGISTMDQRGYISDTERDLGAFEFGAVENICQLVDQDNDGENACLDCDDNNSNINTNATDIPNNDIDENCDGMDEISSAVHQVGDRKINIYPNPTNSLVYLQLDHPIELTIEVYNILGKQLLHKEGNLERFTFDLTNFTAGIYIVKISSNQSLLPVVEYIQKL